MYDLSTHFVYSNSSSLSSSSNWPLALPGGVGGIFEITEWLAPGIPGLGSEEP